MYKTMSLSIPVLFTFTDILSLWFWSLWAAVAPVLADVSLRQLSGMTVPYFLLFQTSESGDSGTLISSPRGLLDRLQWCKRLAGKYLGFVLAYRYFPVKLIWIHSTGNRWAQMIHSCFEATMLMCWRRWGFYKHINKGVFGVLQFLPSLM